MLRRLPDFLRAQPYQLHRRPRPVPGSTTGLATPAARAGPLRCGGEHRSRLSPLGAARSAGRRRGARARRSATPTGNEYLDAAGGAIVVNVGHGRREIAAAMAAQAGRLAYAHGSAFTTEPLEAYAAGGRRRTCPSTTPRSTRSSGGSEAIETALKLARAYHLARGEPDRLIVFARWGSYHGNTLGALDLSGRKPLRRPYEGWLGRFRHVSAAYPYRAGVPGANALGTADELAAELDRGDSRPPVPGRSRRSSPSRSSGRRWRPRSRRTATGRRSPRSAGATACCSSPTRS